MEIALEEKEARDREASLIFSEKSEVGSQMPTSTIEEEVLVSEQLPSRRENVVNFFSNKEAEAEKGDDHCNITNESHEGSPLPANHPELCVGALQDPFVNHL